MSIKMILLAFFGSFFPVVLFNIDHKKIIYAGVSGAIGWIVYSITFGWTNNPVIGSFFGAAAVNIYSEIMARIVKTPASMFYIPGIFPLVPGILAYNTVIFLTNQDFHNALLCGLRALEIAGAIGFAIMLSSSIICNIIKIIKSLKD